MSQVQRISKNNTRIVANGDGSRSVILYCTEIVRWLPNGLADGGTVTLNTGGYFTATTRTRMTQAMNEWGLPIRISFAEGHCAAEVYKPGTGETLMAVPFDTNSITIEY